MFETKYRIVRDSYAGYEVQRKFWWSPWWAQIGINTHSSIELAEEFVEIYKSPVVKIIE